MPDLAAAPGIARRSDLSRAGHLNLRGSFGLRESAWLLTVGLVSCALCLPFINAVYGLGDEGILLQGAVRLLHGDRLYVDFFEFLPPGGLLITAAWFKLIGVSVISARVLVILAISGIACFTYLTCHRVSAHAPLSALIPLAWVIASQGVWTQLNHHWITTLFSMIAAWATISSVARQPERWLAVCAGAAAGAAAMVTPTRGALVILAAAVPFIDYGRYRAALAGFLLGAALIPACLVCYLIANGELSAAFNDVILFTATRYVAIQGVPFGEWWDDQSLCLTYVFQLAALLTLLTCVRNWRSFLHDRLLRSCIAFGLAGFLGCFPRPDAIHIGFAAPLACPLITYCLSRLIPQWRPIYRYAAVAATIVIYMPIIPYWWAAQRAMAAEVVPTPRGNVRLPNLADGTREIIRRIEDTPSEDAFFFYPYVPMLIFLTGREHVSRYDIVIPEYTLPAQYEEACTSALRRATWLVLDRRFDPSGLKQIYPAMRNPEPEETKKFEAAMRSAFEFVAQDGAFEIRRRTAAISNAVCKGIAE